MPRIDVQTITDDFINDGFSQSIYLQCFPLGMLLILVVFH